MNYKFKIFEIVLTGDGDEDIESEVDQQEPSREPQHEQIYLIVWQVTSHE